VFCGPPLPPKLLPIAADNKGDHGERKAVSAQLVVVPKKDKKVVPSFSTTLVSSLEVTDNSQWKKGIKIQLPLTLKSRVIQVNMDEDLVYGTEGMRLIHQLLETHVGTKSGGLEKSSFPGNVFTQVKYDLPEELCNTIRIVLVGRNKMQHGTKENKWSCHLEENEVEPFKKSLNASIVKMCPNYKIVHVNKGADKAKAEMAKENAATIKQLVVQNSKLKTEAFTFKERDSKAGTTISKLGEENSALKKENSTLKKEKSRACATISELGKDIAATISKLEEATTKISNLENEIENLRRIMAMSQNDKKRPREEVVSISDDEDIEPGVKRRRTV
jgi:hypothetical protein